MANHKSAAKRARQTVRRTKVNTQRRSAVKTFEKKLVKALAEKKVAELPGLLKEVTSQMAKAAARGLFKKETASRKVARLSKRVHLALSK